MTREERKKAFAGVCDDYLKAFCEKHEFCYEDSYWVGDEPGGIACIGDYFVRFVEMAYDIDNDVPEEMFLKWYDYDLEIGSLELDYREVICAREFTKINYPSFCKGAPLPYSNEDIELMRDDIKSMDRCDYYVRVMSEIVGTDIRTRSRRVDLVWARRSVMYKLRDEGYTLIKIGRVFGMKHCNVLYGIEAVKLMLEMPRQYKDEMKLWKEFTTIINTK